MLYKAVLAWDHGTVPAAPLIYYSPPPPSIIVPAQQITTEPWKNAEKPQEVVLKKGLKYEYSSANNEGFS